MNVVDAFPDPRLVKAGVKTLAAEFRYVDVWMEGMPDAKRITYDVVNGQGERVGREVGESTSPESPRRHARQNRQVRARSGDRADMGQGAPRPL